MQSKIFKRILSLSLALVTVFVMLASTGCGFGSALSDLGGGKENQGGKTELKGVNPEKGRNAFIDQLGGVSDTFVGAVSELDYTSANAAAEGYVMEEVVGENDAEIVAATSKGTLSNTQIESLDLPEDVAAGIVEIEEIEVSYTISESASNGLMGLNYTAGGKDEGFVTVDKLNKSYTVKVYVIKYENNYKYYSPCPVTGDTISKSYYDSVFNVEKYKNCTMTSTTKMLVDASQSAYGQKLDGSIEMTMTQTIKFADNKVYLESDIKMDLGGMYETLGSAALGGLTNGKVCAYLEADENGTISCYVKTSENADWVLGRLETVGFGKIEELTPFYDQYLDYSYFTKTDFGFALSDNNAQKFIKETLDEMMSMLTGDGWDFNMYAEYYVSDGVLSGMRNDVEIKLDMDVDSTKVSVFETMTQTISCTKYGTTVVEKPFEE